MKNMKSNAKEQNQLNNNYMNKQIQTLRLIVSGRYSKTSQNNHNQEDNNLVDQTLSTIQKQKIEEQKQIKKIIKDKYNTFVKWDFRQSLPHHLKRLHHTQKVKDNPDQNTQNSSMKFSLIMRQNSQKKSPRQINTKLNKKVNDQKIKANKMPELINQQKGAVQNERKRQQEKQQSNTTQMQAIKLDRRQRFKKIQNPLQFLKHYMQKQHYSPTPEQKHLIEKIIHLQKSLQNELSILIENKQPNLEEILENMYKLMNLAVDYNQLLFLSLTICLAADICYFLKDYPRAFYFYNQARVAGSYSHLDKLKIPSLMGMGKICFELHYLQESMRIFRKALQYAWRSNDQNTQLQVYDWFGQIFNQRGKIKESMFYHEKYARKLIEPSTSALKKISKEMLRDFDEHIESLQDSNLDSLFLEYIHLPLNRSYEVKSKQNSNKIFKNYNEGKSPRMNKQEHDFSKQSFLDVKIQLITFLTTDYEFKTQIPNPDKPGSRQLNRMFNKSGYDSFDGKKRQLLFEHSIEYNKIMKKKPEKLHIEKELKKPLDQQVQQMLKEKLQADWYQNMVSSIKKRRMEKVGTLKERVRNSHLSYGKYPSERRRSAIWSTQKINESFNRTLLDWIDPIS